ncbi:MAG TPA: carbon starvation CstA family protein [Longimicrobiales bacterium]
MIAWILIASLAAFFVAYRLYGAWMSRALGLDDRRAVPAELFHDGVDFVPAKTPVLLGHHFSSIAGAGPVVGPILAGLFFGWLPAVIWIVVGSIFVGGVHDLASLVGSIRHKARSVAELAREYMSPLAFKLCLAFIWLALVYVIVVFVDLTAATFEDPAYNGGGVAISAGLFMGLAIIFGLIDNRTRLPIWASTLFFLPLVFAAVWIGGVVAIPDGTIPQLFGSEHDTWNILLLLYALIASVTPVWILLQPRDYLSSYLLYFAVIGGAIGLLIGGMTGAFSSTWPAIVTPAMVREFDVAPLGPLFPILFITVACGACSGFHSIVASGTTSKQLRCESDARRVAYGAMLIEGVVAVVALATVMVLPWGGDALRSQPLQVYAAGIGAFLATFGIPESFGAHFGLLALSTFLLTTLDTCSRLGRYVFQEFAGLDNTKPAVRWISTLATLALPAVLLFITLTDPAGNPVPAWKAIWPVFGATNQLLAGLALLVATVWLKRTGRVYLFAAIPMVFMVAMTMTALWMLISTHGPSLVGGIAAVLFLLGVLLVFEAVRALRAERLEPEPVVWRAAMAGD